MKLTKSIICQITRQNLSFIVVYISKSSPDFRKSIQLEVSQIMKRSRKMPIHICENWKYLMKKHGIPNHRATGLLIKKSFPVKNYPED